MKAELKTVYMVNSSNINETELYNHGVYTNRSDAVARMVAISILPGEVFEVFITPLKLDVAVDLALI